MGQSASNLCRSPAAADMPPPPPASPACGPSIGDLPDECIALVFHSLGSGDRKRCSLVCRRWLTVEGQSRRRLSLDARAPLLAAIPALFSRFDAVSKLALKCDRRSDSIGDDALALIAARCPGLTRLKLRACREVTDSGMAALAKLCPGIRKFSCASCSFGPRGIEAVLAACPSLEELSIKRLRGITDSADPVDAGISLPSLRHLCLKELYNGQCFGPLITRSRNLKSLKLFGCSGDWDVLLEGISTHVPALTEVHFEKLQVSDSGLAAIAGCSKLEVLHLIKTPECTDTGLSAVAEGCRMLRRVHIDGWKINRIGDPGLSVLARRCPNIQELVLIGVNPTAVSLELIASNCVNLERLALCGNDTFGDFEMCCIAAKCNALKKLCIKGCPLSDKGMEVLVEGFPNLIKLKLKKCKNVTPYCVEWLKTARESLSVNLDVVVQVEVQDVSIIESGDPENDIAHVPGLIDQFAGFDIPSSSNGRSAFARARIGLQVSRNFVASTFRKWSSSNGSNNNSHQT